MENLYKKYFRIKLHMLFLGLLFWLGLPNAFGQIPDAQIVGTEGFFRGNVTECGIRASGTFGTSTAIPVGYHASRVGIGVGFIANPANDGWVNYDGDFFLPGASEEGFSIEVAGVNYSNNTSGGLVQVPGSITAASTIEILCDDDAATLTWVGNVAGLEITREYLVTENGLFVQMNTTIRNTTSRIIVTTTIILTLTKTCILPSKA